MASTNFVTIRERAVDEYYGPRAALLRGTVDSGDTDTVVDAALALAGATADHYDYGYIKITSTTDGLAPQGEVRAIDEGGLTAATGSFETVAFTAAVGAGDTMEVHPEFHPDSLDRIANKLLRSLHMPSFFPLTLDLQGSDDNDMEASGVTGWTGGTATPTKSTVAYNGAQSITLTGSGALDYVTAGNFAVVAGKSYYAGVMCQVDSGDSARVRMIDSTNSATIKDSGDTTQEAWMEYLFQWSAPTGCRQAQARLMCVASGDIARWDDYHIWADAAHVYPLPSWLTRKEQLLGVYAFPQGTGGPVADTFRADEMWSLYLPFRFERADTRADTPLYIWVAAAGSRRPFIRALRPLAEVSADYVTTVANTIPLSSTEADALVLGVVGGMHRMASNNTVGEEKKGHLSEAARYEREYDNGTRHLRPEWRENRVEHRRVTGTIA